MSTRSTSVGRASSRVHKHAVRQQVRVYTPELARTIYDVLVEEFGAPERERLPFQGYLCRHDNSMSWHFAKDGGGKVFRFNAITCQVEMRQGQPPKNLGAANKKLAEIREDTSLNDLKRLGS